MNNNIINNDIINKVCLLIIILLIFVVFIKCKCKNNKIDIYNNSKLNHTTVFDYSLMISLKDHKPSEKRLNKVMKIYKKYKLKPNVIQALHWKKDEHIIKTYPIDKNAIINKGGDAGRVGAYGLAGSFYKCIIKAHNEKWEYLLFFEDDAIPIEKNPKKFYKKFNKVLSTLPKNGTEIYFLGNTIYCNKKNHKSNKWYNYKIGYGAHAILFSKESINNIILKLKKSKINQAIDNYIRDNFNIYSWSGDISKSRMFSGLFEQKDTYCNHRKSVMDKFINR
jgi:GR25 family glycosyltransferase involved in LPS biosynthesis